MDNRTCVVTGSSRGIGREIALELGRRGANVVVNYNTSKKEGQEVLEEINASEGRAILVQADVSDPDQVEKMKVEAHDAFGPIHVLVNNAGLNIDRKFVNMTKDEWDRVMDVNLGGMFNCTKAFFNDLMEQDHGRHINISSVVGQDGNYGQSNYATTKSGMFGFTRTISLELARHGSTANCICPGFTETAMLDDVAEDIQEKIRSRIPLRRFATPEDISQIVCFVASQASAYMTGQIIGVNGGMHW